MHSFNIQSNEEIVLELAALVDAKATNAEVSGAFEALYNQVASARLRDILDKLEEKLIAEAQSYGRAWKYITVMGKAAQPEGLALLEDLERLEPLAQMLRKIFSYKGNHLSKPWTKEIQEGLSLLPVTRDTEDLAEIFVAAYNKLGGEGNGSVIAAVMRKTREETVISGFHRAAVSNQEKLKKISQRHKSQNSLRK